MEVRALIARTVERYLAGIVPLAVLSGLLLAALLMMHAATQNSALFGRVYSLLLLVNVLGIVLLLGMILLNIYRLMEQHRARALGSRLTLRLLVMFVLLSVLPVTVVFFFSIQTLPSFASAHACAAATRVAATFGGTTPAGSRMWTRFAAP